MRAELEKEEAKEGSWMMLCTAISASASGGVQLYCRGVCG